MAWQNFQYISCKALSFVVHVLTNYRKLLLYVSYYKTICTSLSLQSDFLYQLQLHAQHEHTIEQSFG